MSKKPESGETDVGRRYSDKELTLILKLAAERQTAVADPRSEGDGFSLAEIEQIAAEAGIDPRFISEAAAALDAESERGRFSFLGAPTKFRFERAIPGEVPQSEYSEIIEAIRREIGVQGQISHLLDSLEWKGKDLLDRHTFITIKSRDGETKIKLFGHWWGPAVVSYITLGSCGLLSTIGLLTTVAPDSALGVAGILAGGLGATYLSARTIWQRISRRSENTLSRLMKQVEKAVSVAVRERGAPAEARARDLLPESSGRLDEEINASEVRASAERQRIPGEN